MATVADRIETYLKQLISKSPGGVIELQRNLLAEKFTCVPSQITYVLSTRFTSEQGYLVESRRGGGGYLKITRISFHQYFASREFPEELNELRKLVNSTIGSSASQDVAEMLIMRLNKEGFLTDREAKLMRAIVARETIPLGLPERDVVRASILRTMLLTIMSNES